MRKQEKLHVYLRIVCSSRMLHAIFVSAPNLWYGSALIMIFLSAFSASFNLVSYYNFRANYRDI